MVQDDKYLLGYAAVGGLAIAVSCIINMIFLGRMIEVTIFLLLLLQQDVSLSHGHYPI